MSFATSIKLRGDCLTKVFLIRSDNLIDFRRDETILQGRMRDMMKYRSDEKARLLKMKHGGCHLRIRTVLMRVKKGGETIWSSVINPPPPPPFTRDRVMTSKQLDNSFDRNWTLRDLQTGEERKTQGLT